MKISRKHVENTSKIRRFSHRMYSKCISTAHQPHKHPGSFRCELQHLDGSVHDDIHLMTVLAFVHNNLAVHKGHWLEDTRNRQLDRLEMLL